MLVTRQNTFFPDSIGQRPHYVFGSHNFHEVTMSYPMRYVRSKRYKLIHNINYQAPYPIDQDFYLSPTFQDLLQRTYHNQSLHWYKNSLKEYYFRPEFELYDLKVDPEEKYNIALKPSYKVSSSSGFERLDSVLPTAKYALHIAVLKKVLV